MVSSRDDDEANEDELNEDIFTAFGLNKPLDFCRCKLIMWLDSVMSGGAQ